MELFIRKYTRILHQGQVYRNVELTLTHYRNGQLAMQLYCAMDDEPDQMEPLMTVSTCIIDREIPPNAIWVKDYSENEGILDWLISNAIVEQEACATAPAGYTVVTAHHLTARFMLEVGDALNRESNRMTVEQFLKNHKG